MVWSRVLYGKRHEDEDEDEDEQCSAAPSSSVLAKSPGMSSLKAQTAIFCNGYV